MPQISVGVDAGGFKTATVYAIDGEVVRVTSSEGVNAAAQGVERAGAAIARAIEQSLDGALPARIFAGVAGAGRPNVAKGVREVLESRFPGAMVGVREDAYIALRAAVPQGDGVVLISGTGSIAYAERAGVSYRCGGYGYLVGDEGSAFAIGAAALKHLLRSYDGRTPADALTRRLESELSVNRLQDVMQMIYTGTYPAATFANIAPLVVELASSGERTAAKIVQAAALELAELVKSVVRSAGLTASEAPIAFAGGMLRENTLLTYLLETRIANELPAMPILKQNPEPCMGALAAAQALT